MLKHVSQFMFLMIALGTNFNGYAQQALTNLDALEWKNRVVLVRVNTQCMQTIKALEKNDLQIDDRHIVWFVFCESDPRQLISNYERAMTKQLSESINQQYFSSRKANVILIGKDGGVKYKSDRLDLDAINQRIDSMPMRQEEMRKPV